MITVTERESGQVSHKGRRIGILISEDGKMDIHFISPISSPFEGENEKSRYLGSGEDQNGLWKKEFDMTS